MIRESFMAAMIVLGSTGAWAAPGQVRFEPLVAGAAQTGRDYVVKVLLDTGTRKPREIDLDIQFDNSVLAAAVSTLQPNLSFVSPDIEVPSTFSDIQVNHRADLPGTVRVVRAGVSGLNMTGEFELFRIHFHPQVVTQESFLSGSVNVLRDGAFNNIGAGEVVRFPVTVAAPPMPSFVVLPCAVYVPEGGFYNVRVALSANPGGAVQAEVVALDGDGDLTVSSGSPLTFASGAWESPVNVQLAAADDADTTSNTREFAVRQSNGSSVTETRFQARELDDDEPVIVGGELADDTAWDDPARLYQIDSTVIVPAGITLTVGPNVLVNNTNSYSTVFNVQGTLIINNSALLLRTYNSGQPDGSAIANQHGILLAPGAVATMTDASIHVRELQAYPGYWQSVDYAHNDYAIYMEDGANLTVDGCSFESLNDNQGARTTFGIRAGAGGVLAVRNGTSFKGFRAGIRWMPNADLAQVEPGTLFSDCEWNGVLSRGGIQDTSLTLRNLPVRIVANTLRQASGQLTLENCSLLMQTSTSRTDTGLAQHGIAMSSGAQVALTGCDIATQELRDVNNDSNYTYRSYALYMDDGSGLTVDGCSLTSLNDVGGARTTFGVRSAPDGELVVRNDTSFKGFRAGIHWALNSDLTQVGADTVFQGCQWNGVLSTGGEQDRSVTVIGMPVRVSVQSLTQSEGLLTLEDCSMLFDTHIRNPNVGVPEKHGIVLSPAASAVLTNCSIETRETQTDPTYWAENTYYYNDYAIYMGDGSHLTVDNCSLESLNDEQGARTSFGVRAAPGGVITVRNNTSFRGFRAGIRWMPNADLAQVAADTTFTDCDGVLSTGGENTMSVAAEGLPLSIKLNALTQASGTLSLVDCSLLVETDSYRGLSVAGGANAVLTGCSVRTREFSTIPSQWNGDQYFYRSFAVAMADNATLTVDACSFESLNDQQGARTTFGIGTAAGATLSVRNNTSFKGFRAGIHWAPNSNLAGVETSTFDDCAAVVATGGTWTQDAVVRNLEVEGVWPIHFENATLTAENATFRIYTNSNPWSKLVGLALDAGAAANFTNCHLIGIEESESNNWETSTISVAADDASLILDGSVLTQVGGAGDTLRHYGVYSSTRNKVEITGSLVTGNDVGVHFAQVPGTHSITGNDFHGNRVYAVSCAGPATVNAQGNWWGSATGPRHNSNAGGTGDPVSDFVDFGNFTQADPFIGVNVVNPVTGQEVNNLRGQTVQSAVELLGLRVSPGSHQFSRITFELRDGIAGDNTFDWSKLSDFRLVLDADGDGNAGAAELAVTVGGIPALTPLTDRLEVKFLLPFETPVDSTKGYLLLVDAQNLSGEDGFFVRVKAEDTILAAALYTVSVSEVEHSFLGARLGLSNPVAGQVQNALSGLPRQTGVGLFGFRMVAPDKMIDRLDIRLSDVAGFTREKIVKLELALDADGDGVISPGESVRIPASQIDVGGNAGIVRFEQDFSADGSYILAGDFQSLNGRDTLTISLAPEDVHPVQSIRVVGSTTSARHEVSFTYALSVSPAWIPEVALVEGAGPLPLSVSGFQFSPFGRPVLGLRLDITQTRGVVLGDFLAPALYQDVDNSGGLSESDTLIATGTVESAGTGFVIRFDEAFWTIGQYLAVVEVANRHPGDEWTLTFNASGVTVPPVDTVTGGLPPLRFTVGTTNILPNSQRSRGRWTLDYRSPSGRRAVGAMSQAGDKVVLGFDTGSACVFDTNSNTPLRILKEMYDQVKFVGFTQGDQEVVTVTRDGAVNLWDLRDGARRSALFSDLLVTSAGLSPDKTKLMVLTEGKVLLMDIETKSRLWEFVPGSAQALAIAFSPTESKVLVGASNNNAYLIDSATGNTLRTLSGHVLPVTAVSFSGDGLRMFTGSQDGVIQIWGNNGGAIRTLSTQGQGSQGASLSPDGSRLAIVTGNDSAAQLRLYSVESGNEIWAVNLASETRADGFGHWGGTLSSIGFDGTGQRILITSEGESKEAHNASFRVVDGKYERSWGIRGNIASAHSARPRMTQPADAVFFETDAGMNLLPASAGIPIHWSPRLTTERGFDIAGDGSKLVWIDGKTLRIDTASPLEGFAPLAARDIEGFREQTNGFLDRGISVSRSGRMMIAGDRLFSLPSGNLLADYAVTDGEFGSAFNFGETLWGFSWQGGAGQSSIITCRTFDPNAVLVPPVVDTRMSLSSYSPFKMFFTPDNRYVAAAYQNLGVQFFERSSAEPFGLYRFPFDPGRGGRVADAALSEDGSLLLIGGSNFVALYDVLTGIVIRYFYPQHVNIVDSEVRAVQFADRDNKILIGWNYNYVEVYKRSQILSLEITPTSRSLARGESQEFRVSAIYDDTTIEDVTPGSGRTNGDNALLEIDPPSQASLSDGVVTVAPGASGQFDVIAAYREGGQVLTAKATVSIGQSVPVELTSDPPRFTMVAGVQKLVRYRVRYSDGYERDVSELTAITVDTPEAFDIEGNRIGATLLADLGGYELTGSYSEQNIPLSAITTITVVAPQTEWERFATTGGGSANAGAYSPDGTHFAAGWSSGSIGLYEVGLSPSQYRHARTFLAHDAPVRFVAFLSDTVLLSAGEDGRILLWDTGNLSTPQREMRHDGVLRCAALDGASVAQLVVGDLEGRITLYNLADGTPEWSVDGHSAAITAIAMDGELVVSGGDDWVTRVRNRVDGSAARTLHLHTGPVVGVGFTRITDAEHNQHAVIYTVGSDRTAVFSGRQDFGVLRRLEFPSEPSSAGTGGGYLFITTNSPPATWMYNEDGLLLRWIENPPGAGAIETVQLDPTGKYLLTGRRDGMGSFQFWELGRGLYRDSIAHSFPLQDAKIIGNDRVVTECDKRIMDWRFSTEAQVTESRRLLETGYFVPSSFSKMDLSWDGKLLAARVNQSIFLYQPEPDLLWKTLHVPQAQGPYALSPNGLRLAEAYKETRLWELANLSLVGKESRVVRELAFKDDDRFLGIIPPNALGIWNNRAQAITFAQTRYEPRDMGANKDGSRCAVVTFYTTTCGDDCIIYHYYLEVYDITDDTLNDPELGSPVRVAPPLYLFSVRNMYFIDWAIGISQDGALALVGPGKLGDPSSEAKGLGGLLDELGGEDSNQANLSVRLINLNDVSILREYLPPSGTLAAQAGFSRDNSVMFLAWQEGYAELFKRLVPLRLRIGLLEEPIARTLSKDDLSDAVVDAELESASAVGNGKTYRIIVTAIYDSGKELRVSLACDYRLDMPGLATLNRNILTVSPEAPDGATFNVTAAYNEIGGPTIEKTIVFAVGGATIVDSDADGLPDDWEIMHFGNLDQGPADDTADMDGLTNAQEYELGTDPTKADTDNDGFTDSQEVANGTNPIVPTPTFTAVVPDRAWLFGGTVAHITGRGFITDQSSVLFNGVAAEMASGFISTDTDLYVTVPALADVPLGAGSEVEVDLSIANPSNQSVSGVFTYIRYMKTEETAGGATGGVTTNAYAFDRAAGSGNLTVALDGDNPDKSGVLNIPVTGDVGSGDIFAIVRATQTPELAGATGFPGEEIPNVWNFTIHLYDSRPPFTEYNYMLFPEGRRTSLTFPIDGTDITGTEVAASQIGLFSISSNFDFTLGAMAHILPGGEPEGQYTVRPADLVNSGKSITVRMKHFSAFALRRGGPISVGSNEVQTLSIDATGGTFTLTFRGQTTGAIPFDVSAAELQAFLEGLSSVGADNLSVVDNGGGTFSINFIGALGRMNVPEMTGDGTGLTGGAGLAIATVVDGKQFSLVVSPSSRTVGAAGGTVEFTVSNEGGAPINWSATVRSGGDFMSITSGNMGTDDGTIIANVTEHAGSGNREGVIVVQDTASSAEIELIVLQEAPVCTGCNCPDGGCVMSKDGVWDSLDRALGDLFLFGVALITLLGFGVRARR